ncbi:unnamed protein product [Rhizophagus irregularis]|nr:unnamed protein product [Rhizophagus irregularis]
MSETYIEIEKDTGHSIETDEKEIETDGRDIETDGKDIETDEKDTRHNIDNEYNFGDVNERHRGRPITLTIASPDGKYLVTYSYDDDSIVGAEKSTRIFATNFEFFRVKYIGLVFEKYSKIIDNENYICLDNEDKLIIYSIELKIPIASLDKNNVQSQNITNHTEYTNKWDIIIIQIIEIKKPNWEAFILTDNGIFIYSFSFKNDEKTISASLRYSFYMDLRWEGLKGSQYYKGSEYYEGLQYHRELFSKSLPSQIYPIYFNDIYVVISALLFKAMSIDENERKIKKIDKHLIKIINDNIVIDTNKRNIIIIEIIEIKIPNWEAFILTDNGWKGLEGSKRLQHYKELFSREWPLSNYDSFKMYNADIEGWNLYLGSSDSDELDNENNSFNDSDKLDNGSNDIDSDKSDNENNNDVDIIRTLFKAALIDGNERKIKKIDINLISLLSGNIIKKTNKRNIVIIEIIEIKTLHNWEAFILTDYGIFIYLLNSNSNEKLTSASLRYFYFTDLRLKPTNVQYYEDSILKSLKVDNENNDRINDSFKKIKGVNSDELDNENNDRINEDNFKMNNQTIDSDVKIIQKLFDAVSIEEDKREKNKIDIHLISLLYANIIKDIGFTNIIIIEIIEIKTPTNWEAFVLTINGIFIYSFFKNDEKTMSASLRYSYYMNNVLHYKELFSTSLPSATEINNEITDDVKIIQQLFKAVSIEEAKKEKNEINFHFELRLRNNISKDIKAWSHYIIDIIEIIEIKREFFILTNYGIFIYYLNLKEKLSLRYFYYIEKIKENEVNHFEELFSKSLPSPNYESFEKNNEYLSCIEKV